MKKTIFTNKEEKVSNIIKLGGEIQDVEPANTPSGFGQLPLDILENNKEIIIMTPLAGVDLDSAEIIINNDVLTIKGTREVDNESFNVKSKDYYLQECYWGEFSRSVILPPNSDSHNIEATQKNHILYIRIPKRINIQMRIVKIKT